MRQITNENIKSVCKWKYYAVTPKMDGLMGIIIRDAVDEGKFRVHCTSELTLGNYWGPLDGNTLQEVISETIKFYGFTVQEFDTERELFEFILSKIR